MKKLLPHPGLSVLLLGIWLLENNSFAPGHILLGGILALLIPLLTSLFLPGQIRLTHPLLMVRYLSRLVLDILVANIQVSAWIVQPNQKLKPVFIQYDLRLRSPLAISLLANPISLTPGTVSCDISPDRQQLLIHSLHAPDPNKIIMEIHQRYEKPLLEAFQP